MPTLAELVIKITGDATGFEDTAASAQSSAAAMGAKLGDAGKKLTVGLTLPLVALGGVAVNAASDLDESANKVQVVFGDSAGVVRDFADSAALNLGITEESALAAAGTFGNLFTASGLSAEAAAQMSTEVLTLSADLGSFNNLGTDQVLEKIQAGAIGSFEPLRSLGIILSAAGVNAKAMELGLADANGELSDAALIQARMALITEQASSAQGDFVNTSDGLANSTKIAKAQLGDLAAQLGTDLLPIALQVVEGISGLISKFTEMDPKTQKTILSILGLLAALGPVLFVVGKVVGVFSALSPIVSGAGVALGAVGAPVLLLIAAIGLLIFVIAKFGTKAKENFINLSNQIGIILAAIRTKISEFFANLIASWSASWQNLVDTARAKFDIDWGSIGSNIISGIAGGISAAAGGLADAAKGAIGSAIDSAKAFLGISSPATMPRKEVGFPTGEGTGLGIIDGLASMKNVIGNAVMGATQPGGQGLQLAGGGAGAGMGGGAVQNFDIVINNPVAEEASVSIPRAQKKLAFLGGPR